MSGTVEWCVMRSDIPQDPHRGPMTEAEAREWVREAEQDDEMRVGLFFVASRRVSPWEREV